MTRFTLSPVCYLLLAFLISAPSSAQDWYIHRTSEVMKVPPWYCYCYRMTQSNVIPGVPTHPVEMQISYDFALSRLDAYAALPETCPANCGFGSSASDDADPPAPPTPPPDGGPGAPHADLSGRWHSSATGEIIDFIAAPSGTEFSATRSGYDMVMRYLPSGRVRVEVLVKGGRSIATEGDLIVQGPAGRSDYLLVLDPLPGGTDRIVFSPR